MTISKLTILLLYITSILTIRIFRKVLVEDTEALCLDGTLGAYYANEGTHPTKILLSFEGGGWCGSHGGIKVSIQNCYGRSKSDLGSSAKYPEIWIQNTGIHSDSPLNQLRDYSVFYLKYCDGTGHQGYRKYPIKIRDSMLYFRGHSITKAQLESINKYHGLWTNATDVIITGQSAGGLATFLWSNYIAQRVQKGTKVWALPDSGIFLDSTNYLTLSNDYKKKIQNLMNISNEQVPSPAHQCNAAYPGQEYKCMFAQYIHPFVKVPLFAIQSPYDSWSILNILGLNCGNKNSLEKCNETQLKYIEDYHTNTSRVLKAIGCKQKNGFWAPSCSNHVYSTRVSLYKENFRIPAGSVYSLMHSISIWMAGTSNYNGHIDYENWPMNKPCSGIVKS